MRRLFTPGWLFGHAMVWLGVAVCLALGWWQAGRAVGGNTLSWAYTFEWPLFAIFLIYLWIREMRLALGRDPGAASKASRSGPASGPETVGESAGGDRGKRGPVITRRQSRAGDADDPQLAAYNRYLAWLSEHPEARPSDYRVLKES